MNKVFVTGADGMLGNSVCRELITKNYVVKAFCINNTCSHTLSSLGIEIVYGNILDSSAVFLEMQDCDFVIHVAANTCVWPRRNPLINEVNIQGTLNVMEAAKKLNIKRMVHISSASVYAPGTLEKPGTEESPFDGWKYGMDYMESKYTVQNLLLSEFKSSGFPIIIINPTFMIGPYDSGPSSGKMILGLYNKSIPGYASGGKNFICSQDVAVAVVNALNMGRIGECYIAGNMNLSYEEFFRKVSDVLKVPFHLKQVSPFLIKFIGICNSITARLLRRPPKLSYGMACIANLKQYYNPEKARRELQLPSTPIEIGIQRSMDWFKTNNYIK